MAKHPIIAKTSVLFDVMPRSSKTDLDKMLACVRSISMDGLHWGASERESVAFGIEKMKLMCTVEDDKVSIEDLQKRMMGFKEFVQSVEVVAMNKI